MSKEIWSWVRTFLLAIVIALLIRNYVFALYVVDGSSMQPTLADGQILMVNNLRYRIWEPQRGDVIVFTKTGISGTHRGNWLVGGNALVKRVIALPGDTVFIDNGQIFVNDVALTEEYIDYQLVDNYGPITVEEGHLFVLGDNRYPGGSLDSRSFGTIPISSVVGRADFVVLPDPHKVD